MPVYMVRHRKTREVYGIVWGNAWDVVDQYTDPFQFEVAVVKTGGIISNHKPKIWSQWEDEDEDDETVDKDISDYHPDSILTETLACQGDLVWKPMSRLKPSYV